MGASRVIVGGIHMIPLPLLRFTWPSKLSLLRWWFLTAEWECLPPPPNQRTLVKGERENDTRVRGKVSCPHGDVVLEASSGNTGTSCPHDPSAHTVCHILATFLASEGLGVWIPLGKWSSQPPKTMVSDKQPRLYENLDWASAVNKRPEKLGEELTFFPFLIIVSLAFTS